jgi:MerR family copper efflux transcriptional regulator
VSLSDVAFATRLQDDAELREAISGWRIAQPTRPVDVAADDWLRFEQDKHERLLAAAA